MFDYLSKILPGKQKAAGICCLHFGRCGSTLLGNMLNSHPRIEWAGELFHSHHERADRTQNLKAFELIQDRLVGSNFRYFGFETKFQHLDANGLKLDLHTYLSKLTELGIHKFIVLKRKNYLRQAISVARGQETRKWHISTSDELRKYGAMMLDIDCISLGGTNRSILNCFQFLDKSYANALETFQRLNICCLELFYENHLMEQPLNGYKLVADFIGTQYVEPSISVKKLESRSVDQIVSNFQSLQNRLEGTEYEWMCYH